MTLAALLQKQWGIRTRSQSNPVTITVGTSVTKILDNNPNRLSYVVINLSANDLYIGFDRAPGATNGIYLAPNGGSATLTWDRDFELVCWQCNAIAGGAGSAIFIQEVLIDKM